MAKARRKDTVRLLGVARRRRPALMMSTALQATVVIVLAVPGFVPPAQAQPAPNARPTGGAVVAGSAAISNAPAQTTINQTSQRAAITWQSYNVGSQQSVVYHQPSPSSVTLNRVTGPNPSQIAGRIEANGSIVLMNQAGVTFLNGAQVNTNGLMVTAASMSDGAMKGYVNTGTMRFDRDPSPNARVENRGNITIKQAGLAALVAPSVANSGTITAQLGHVVLAGAKKTTVDMYGDGLVSIDVSGEVTQVPTGPDGKPVTALVTNTGVIRADGGTVQLTARQADGLVTRLVDAGGSISANSVGGHTGVVALNGIGGGIVVQGQLSATGQLAGSKGGDIAVNTDRSVTVAATARIDASGKAGGGTVAIGTTLARAKGGPKVASTLTAQNVQVQHGAVVRADATEKGDGGHITLLSDDATQMDGLLTARGGPQGGDGGFVEVSGGSLGLNSGSIDVSAPLGQTGEVLFDPDNLTIVSSGGNIDGSFTGTLLAGDNAGLTDTLSGSVLNGISGNVTLQAKNTLDVASSFTIGSGGLTMQAGNVLRVDLGVTVAASGDILAQTTATGIGIDIVGLLTSTGGSVTLRSAAGSQVALANQGTVSVPTAGKSIVLQADTLFLTGGHISAPSGTVEIAPTTNGNTISLAGANSPGTLGLANNFSGINAAELRLGAVTFNNVMTTMASDIVLDGNVNLGTASTVDLHATGNVFRSADSFALTAGTLTGDLGGGLNLAGGVSTGNTIGTIGSFTVGAGSSFALLTANGVTFAGPVDAGTALYVGEVAGGNINITGSVSASNNIQIYGVGGGTLAASGSLIAPSVTLGMSGSIRLTGMAVVGQAGGTLDVSASNGISEDTTGTILAGTMDLGSGLYGLGNVSLLGTANAITTLGTFTSTGNFALVSGSALTVGNTLSASGNIYLQDSNAGGITNNSTITAGGAGKTLSLLADSVTNTGSISNTGGTIELAPYTTGGTITLGTGSLASLAGLSASLLRIGAVTNPGGTLVTTAGSINLASSFGSGTVALDLESSGSITETAGAILTASTLTGQGGSILLLNTNQIGTLGNMVSGGNLEIITANAVVAGTLTAGSVNATPNPANTAQLDIATLSGPLQLGVASGQAAVLNGGTVVLVAAGNVLSEPNGTIIANRLQSGVPSFTGVTLNGTANIISSLGSFSVGSGDFSLVSQGSLAAAGPITAANITLNAGTIGIPGTLNATTLLALGASAGGVSETGSIIAGTLASVGTIAGGATLTGSNTIGTLGTLAVSGGDLALLDSGTLTVAGPVSAPNASLSATGLTINGAITVGTLLALGATATGVTQAVASVLTAPTLTSIGTIAGGVTLAGTGNAIASLGSFHSASDFALTDSGSLSVAGLVDAPNITLNAGTLGIGGTLNATTLLALGASSGGVSESGSIIAGTLASSGTIAGGATLTGSNTIGTLGTLTVSDGDLTLSDTSSLTVAGPVNAPNASLSASGLTINGAITVGTLLALGATATGITQAVASVLTAPTLTSIGTIAGGVTLAGTGNAIASLGSFHATSDISLTDSGSLSVAGLVDAPNITLNAGTIGIPGTLNATTLLALGASAGGVSETGSIIAGTLASAGTIAGGATLTGSNTIGTLGSLAVSGGDLALLDTGSLSVAGPVSGPNITLDAATIGIPGTLNATTLLALGASAGGVSETGSIIAGTLASDGTITGGATLTGSNTIGALGTVTIGSGNFTLIDTGRLSVAGVVNAPTISLDAGTIGIPGTLDAGTLLALGASAGGIAEPTTGVVITPTLVSLGTIAGGVTLDGTANAIGAFGDFHFAGTLALTDPNSPLAIDGTLSAGTTDTVALNAQNVTIASGALLSVGTLGITTSNGGVNESATGTIVTNSLSISTTGAGDVALLSPQNQILASTGIQVANGNLILIDDPTLTLTGAYSGSNLYFQVSQPGDTLAVGDGGAATLTAAPGGRISLIADNLTENAASTLSAANGTIEIAPLSTTVAEHLGGTSQLAVDTTLLGNITTGTLVIGRYTGLDSNTTVTAAGIQVDGSVDLTGKAGTLELITLGSVTEPAGAIIVGTLTGSAGVSGSGAVALGQTGNDIGTLAAFGVTGGDFFLRNLDGGTLTTAGTVSATNITITAGTLTAASLINAGGSASLTTTTGSLTQTGTVDAMTGATLSAANGLTNSGTVSVTSGPAVLTATAGTLTQSGTVQATGASGSVSETASAGDLSHSGLTSAGSGGATLSAAGTLTQTAGIITAANGTVSLTGASITQNGGTIQTTGSVTDPILLTGTGTGSNGITQTAGALIQGSSIGGSVTLLSAGTIALGGTVNALDSTAGTISAWAQGSTLLNSGALTAGARARLMAGTDLTNSGTVTVTNGAAELLATGGTLDQTGMVSATSLGTLDATTTLTNTGSVLVSGGPALLNAGGDLFQRGLVRGSSVGEIANGSLTHSGSTDATGTAAVLQAKGGTLDQSGTVTGIQAGLLTGATGLTNSGLVSVSFVNGMATLTATTGALVQSGTVQATGTAGSVTETASAGDFTDSGLTSAGSGGATLSASGTLTQTAGIITAANGTVSLTGASIAQNGGTIQTTGSLTDPILLTGTGTGSNGITQAAGALIQGSGIGGSVTLLSAGTIALGGTVNALDSTAGTISASAQGSTLLNSGALTAGALAALTAATNLDNTGIVTVNSGPAILIATAGTLGQTGTVSATSGGTLTAATDLTNTGSVLISAGAATLTATSGNLTQGGLVSGTSVGETAGGSLTHSGASDATTTTAILQANGGTLDQNGTITAITGGTLTAATDLSNTGSVLISAGPATLTATSGNLTQGGLVRGTSVGETAGGSLTHSGASDATTTTAILQANGGTLDQSGTITAITGATLTAQSTLTNSGMIAASDPNGVVALTSTNADIVSSGTAQADGGAGIVQLIAHGAIDQTAGAITASGTAGNVALTAGGSIRQSGGTILSGGTGTIAAAGAATPSLSLTANGGTIEQDAGALISTTSTAGVIALQASGDISLAGSVLAPGTLQAGIVPLSMISAGIWLRSGTGSITEAAGSGMLQAGLLIGSAGQSVTLTGTSGTGNLVANLGSFAAGGNFVLTDDQSLAVIAPVTSTTGSVVIADTHLGGGAASSLINQSTIQGQTGVSLIADADLTNEGTVNAVGNDISLSANGGTLGNSGLVDAAANAVLTAQTDLLNSGTIQARGGNAELNATTGTVNNTGLIIAANDAVLVAMADIDNQANATITAGHFGTLSAGAAINDAGLITVAGSGVAATPSLQLLANTGSIAEFGTGTIAATNDAGVIAITAAAAGQDVTLAGQVLAAGSAGRISVSAGGSLTQSAGTILAGGTGSIAADGTASPNLLLVAQGGTIGQSAGAVIDATNTAGVVGLQASGDLRLNGSVLAGTAGGLSLVSTGGSIVQSAGSSMFQAGTLVGTAASGVLLNGTAGNGNLFANLGSFATGAGDLVMVDQQSLAIVGTVIASAGAVQITDTHLGGNAASSLTNQSVVQGQAGVTLTADVNLSNSGTIASSGSGVSLAANAGSLSNASLISAGTSVTLRAGTDIGNTGTVRALGNDASLTATAGALTNSGTITAAQNAAATAGTGIDNTGTIQSTTSDVSLTAGSALANSGAITAAENAVLAAGTSVDNTGFIQATGNRASLTAQTGTLSTTGTIAAGISIGLNALNGATTVIGGVLSAPTITADAGTNAIALNDGVQIVTGGLTNGRFLPHGTLNAGALPPSQITTAGAYFSGGSFTQSGLATIVTLSPAANSVLRITTANGPIALDGSHGISASDTWLILDAGSGFVSGRVNVKALDVSYSGTAGASELTGVVNRYTGHAAAGAANIEPGPRAQYHMNSCPIHSVSCVLLPTQGVPVANPIDEIFLGSFFNPQDEGDLLLPIVSDQDY